MQPFKGIRVIDFTHVYAGPFATFQLGILGAEVIKVESPEMPDQMRSEGVDAALNAAGLGTNYLINNQGKKAITLNIKSDEGIEIARKLIESADVVVENYSGTLKRAGLGADRAMQLNPRLIYCEMSGFGEENRLAGRPAYDPVVQAASGMMSVNGESDQEFMRVGPPLIDYGTGAQTAFAIASALYQRTVTGKGQTIEANMLDAALVMMSPLVANAAYAGKTDTRSGNVPPGRPGYGVYECSDAAIMLGAFSERHHRRLFTLLNLSADLDLPESASLDWVRDNAQLIRKAIQERMLKNTALQWETILNDADIPASRVRDLHEMLENEQANRAAHSQFHRFDGQSITAPIAAFRFADGGPELDVRCARHGEDTESVLSDLGYDTESIRQLKQQAIV
ncbi:MAG: CaiB/BaiF CoA-transferase family protein [Pseudomonadota bacterium]